MRRTRGSASGSAEDLRAQMSDMREARRSKRGRRPPKQSKPKWRVPQRSRTTPPPRPNLQDAAQSRRSRHAAREFAARETEPSQRLASLRSVRRHPGITTALSADRSATPATRRGRPETMGAGSITSPREVGAARRRVPSLVTNTGTAISTVTDS